MTDIWPWLVLIALGAFHGLNPAMGWLFAVALGLYRHSRKVVLVSLIPIALGHAAAIAVVVYAVMALGTVIDAKAFRMLSGVLLIGWGLYHTRADAARRGWGACSSHASDELAVDRLARRLSAQPRHAAHNRHRRDHRL
jgi:hypothetical protein